VLLGSWRERRRWGSWVSRARPWHSDAACHVWRNEPERARHLVAGPAGDPRGLFEGEKRRLVFVSYNVHNTNKPYYHPNMKLRDKLNKQVGLPRVW
jgi:hypothetical protein